MLLVAFISFAALPSHAEAGTRHRGKAADMPTFGINGGAGFMGILKADGSLWSSGYNAYGQLGNGTITMNGEPIQAGTDTDWTILSVGGDHMAGIKADGTLWTWGANHTGQLGIGTGEFTKESPTQVTSAGTAWRSVAAGGANETAHTIALRADGTVWAWGDNSSGQVGDGTTTQRRSPVQVTALGSGNVAIAAGANHSMAIKADGTLWAWGSNASGQLGTNNTANYYSPVQVNTTVLESFEPSAPAYLPWTYGGNALWTTTGSISVGSFNFYPAGGSYMSKAPTITASQTASRQFTLDCQAGTISFYYAVGSEPNFDGLRFYIDDVQQSFFSGSLTSWNYASYPIAAGLHTFKWEYSKDGSVDTLPDTAVIDYISITPGRHNWVSVSAGTNHTVAVNADGTVWAWGDNGNGQLGDGTTTQRLKPIKVTGAGSNVAAVSAGNEHTLAVKSSGELWGWGSNGFGQVGCGGSCGSTLSPQRIGTGNEWVAAAAGNGSSLGTMSDGTVWAWGLNSYGQLGDGTVTDRSSPVKILWKGNFWSDAQGGYYHSLAWKSDGTLWTWGYNGNGQLGDKSYQDKHMPQKVGDNRWVSAGTFNNHSMALKSDGTLWDWGYNGFGQLGNGSYGSTNSPAALGSSWKSLMAGYYHSAGIKSDGSLWTWGYNGYGQLGNENTTTLATPQQIQAGTTWLSVSGGIYHTAAVKSDGTLWTWGYNYYGQLGDGTTTNTVSPVAITSAGNGWLTVDAGSYHTVALKSDGTLWAWGNNGAGQLGLGSTTQQVSPQQILVGTTWKAVSAGGNHTVAIKSNGTLWAWGNNGYGQLGLGTGTQQTLPQQVGADNNWVAVATGYSHTLAVKSDGTLWAWGYNANGQIGDWSTINKNVPTWIDPQYTWSSLGTGVGHTLAVKADGSLWGWGNNNSGELGNGTITDSLIPKQIGYTSDWEAVAAGWGYSIGKKIDGTLWGWGYGYYGQLGGGLPFNQLTPQQIGSDTWKYFAVGWQHTLGIKSDGTLWAWGSNSYGKLGNPGAAAKQLTPYAVLPGTTWTSVAAGYNHTLGIKDDGTLWAWGDNTDNQLGCGAGCSAPTTTPQQIGTANNWIAVAAGNKHSLGITSDGKLYGWGDNSSGQTGLGSGVTASTPTQIGSATNWVAVDTIDSYALAVDSTGKLYSWGNNSTGQLGNGGYSIGYTPVQVGTGSGWTRIFSAGFGHSVAADTSGRLYTWGNNGYGQLGDGTQNTLSSPARISTALAVNLSGLGLGTITAQGLSCAGRFCSGSYEYGSSIVLTATADPNSSFAGWSGCSSVAGNLCTLNLAQLSATVYALFNDTSKPTGSIAIAADYTSGVTKYTRNTTLNLALSASDPVGVAQMQFSEDGSTWTTAEAYSTAKQYTIAAPVDKTYTIWVRFIDAAGNQSISAIKDNVILKRSGPTGGSISITPGFVNGGNKYTKNSPVTLSLGAADTTGVAAMQFCNETPATVGSCLINSPAWSSPETYATTKSWAIPTENGSVTVYARYRDNVGNWSATATDTIIFDSSLPSGSVVINDNAVYTTSRSVQLTLACSDNAAGCSQMQFSSDGLTWDAPETFSSPKSGYLLGDGPTTAWGWGYNPYGHLGIGSTVTKNLPQQSGSGSDWATISSGGYHTLAVRSDGTLWAWGRNDSCQLGLGETVACDDTTGYRMVPTQVGTDADWVSAAAGNNHSLAIKADGSLWAWGNNGYGQLGIEGWANQNTPQAVAAGSSWRSVSAGYFHTLAIKSDNSLWAWGYNWNGQLGTGDTTQQSTPQLIAAKTTWTAVAAGIYHSLGIQSDGSLWSWGDSSYGQLGNGGTDQQLIPKPVAEGTVWSSISAGAYHSLGIQQDGSLWSWGYNDFGQLGCGSSCESTLAPQQILSGTAWSMITGGGYHSAGIRQDGTLWSWGFNGSGQLGSGDYTETTAPQAVATDMRFKTVIAGVAAFSTVALPISDTKYVFAKYRNNLGTWSTALLDSIVLDQNPPTGSLLVNNASAFTKSATVNLALTCSDPTSGCAEMCLSNNGSCSSWEPFAGTRNAWALDTTSGDGGKNVSVWFKDTAGNVSPTPVTAAVFLDQTGPAAALTFSGLATYTTNPGVILSLSCSDPGGSGCAQMQFSNDGASWSTLTNFSPTLAWNLADPGYGGTASEGSKTVHARFTDTAGNVTTTQKSIFLDSVLPAGSLTFQGLTAYATSENITLNPVCSDSGGAGSSSCSRMQFSNDGVTWSPLVALAGSLAWDLTDVLYGGTSSDGPKTVFARYQDTAGNLSSAIIKKNITLDRVNPTGSITINNSAAFTTATSVTLLLSCNDTTSGCATMEFNNDGGAWSAPQPFNSTKSWALASTNGIRTVNVRYTDNAGRTSSDAAAITLDSTAPTTSVLSPSGFSNLVNAIDVTLACDDGSNSSGCAATYFTIDGTIPTTSSTLYSGGPITISGVASPTTIKFFSVDNLGNTEAVKSVPFTFVAGFTTLTLDTPPTLLQSGLLDVSGKLTRYPDSVEIPNNGMDLSGLPVSLTITGPAGSQCATPCTIPAVTTYTSLGHYKFTGIDTFNYPGIYTVKAHFNGTGLHQSADSSTESLLVGASAGYAIIVEGKVDGGDGLLSHNKTTNRIYAALKDRGFEDDNIMYYNYAGTMIPGVDAVPTKAAIQDAITTWARDRMNGAPAPLYVIFVDHGNSNTFYIYPDTINPGELNSWLTNLESSLVPAAKLQKRIIILGACFSGSFLDTLKQGPDAGAPGPEPPYRAPNAGRVVISSAAADEQSYKGPNEPDGIRSGEFFIEELFKSLKKGVSLKTAFVDATSLTRAFTSQGSASPNALNAYHDTAVQHPLLEDDGAGAGSNTLIDGTGDGMEAATIHLGIGVTNASLGPADIKSVTATQYLGASEDQAILTAEVYSNSAVSSAWFEVKAPLKTLVGNGQTGQLDLDLPRWAMSLTGGKWQATYGSNPLKATEKFFDPGKYEVYYFTKSKNAEISEMRRSLVYKDSVDNLSSPAAFDLIAPPDSGDIEHPTKVRTEFNIVWDPTSDPDGDPLTYTVQIATDALFTPTSIVFQKEELENSWYYVTKSDGLSDATQYYWRVLAVDPYGKHTPSTQTWRFETDDTNFPLVCMITGSAGGVSTSTPTEYAVKAYMGANFASATLVAQTTTFSGGTYLLNLTPGNYFLKASATGFASGPEVAVSMVTCSPAPVIPLLTVIDIGKPVITGFSIPLNAASATVAITALTATDNVAGALGYCVTETSSPAGCVWGAAPVSYTFSGITPGVATPKSLYIFAKDAAGNISDTTASSHADVTVTIPLPAVSLTVSTQGGVGTVNCTINGVSASCGGPYSYNDTVLLQAVPSWRALFGSWSGSYCNGSTTTDCNFTLDTTATVSAAFIPINRARVGTTDFSSLQDAYDDPGTGSGDLIKVVKDYVFQEKLLLDKGKSVTIDGGYTDLSGSSSGGATVIEGAGGYTLRIQDGRLNVRGVTVR